MKHWEVCPVHIADGSIHVGGIVGIPFVACITYRHGILVAVHAVVGRDGEVRDPGTRTEVRVQTWAVW